MNYTDYLKSDHWRTERTRQVQKHRRCRLCGAEGVLNVHHRRYRRHGKSVLFAERNSDLYVLCRTCHETWHRHFGLKEMSLRDVSRIKNLLSWGRDLDRAMKIVSTRYAYERERAKLKPTTAR